MHIRAWRRNAPDWETRELGSPLFTLHWRRRRDEKRNREGMEEKRGGRVTQLLKEMQEYSNPKHTNSQRFVDENPKVGQYICY